MAAHYGDRAQPSLWSTFVRMAGRIDAVLSAAGQRIGPFDTLIAAQALVRDLTLVTHAMREFGRVAGLRTEDREGDR